MAKIPTAEEALQARFGPRSIELHSGDVEEVIEIIKTQCKLHVEAALKAASEKGKAWVSTNGEWTSSKVTANVDKDSILNAYPLTNIK